jgi:hypothetical protein
MTLAALAVLLRLTAAPAALAPPDSAALLAVYRAYAALDGGRIWPGFRPDTIPVSYVVPARGILLCGWRGDLPTGFTAIGAGAAWASVVDRAAANTNADLAGRAVAQVVVSPTASPADLLFLSAHEAFHVFERSRRRPGRRFGGGENAFLVTRYPMFDADNEAGFALEARLLAAALEARTDSAARALDWEFLAARDARQRTLGSDLAEFETMAEMNEGLAEYSGYRALQDPTIPPAWRNDPSRAALRQRLDSVTTQTSISLRLRFYVTGPALGRLLDRLTGGRWKPELEAADRTIQEELALASGYADREVTLRGAARRRLDWPALQRQASATIAAMRALRQAQADSVLAAPGLVLVIDAAAVGGLGTCGIDPQNLLQVGNGILLHRRWVRPCAGLALESEFTTPALQDDSAATVRAVIGDESAVQWTSGGDALGVPDGARLDDVRELRIRSGAATVHVLHASVSRQGRVVTVRVLRAP